MNPVVLKMFSLSSRLPLLSKELKEQANRKRMYVIRVVYALIMLVVAIACLVDLHYTYQRNPMAALGYGRYVFEAVVISHLMAIYSLIPLLAAGSLADERERNTLPLLLLTRLDPWTIVIEKILGHAVPMLVLLLVSLPVAGFAYSMGGVNEPQLLMAIWLLPLAVFQITALVVMCSAASRTTVTAGLSAIAIGTAVVLITALIDEFGRIHSPWLYCLIIPAFFEFGSSMPFSDLVILSIPAMVSTVVFVVMARWFLVRSLIANEGWSVRGLTERLIGFFRGPAPVPCDPPAKVQITSLPEQRPVLWREVRRTYLGQLRNQLIVIAAAGLLMTPLLYFLTIHPGRQDEEFAVVYFCYLGFVGLLILVQSAGQFSSERSRQTLDALLATPLSNREIIGQKLNSVLRMACVFAIPWIITVLLDSRYKQLQWSNWFQRRSDVFDPAFFQIATFSTVVLYAVMIAWISLLCGLIFRTQIRAIAASLVWVVAMSILPLLIIVSIFNITGIRPGDPECIVMMSSPLMFLVLIHLYDFNVIGISPWTIFVINTVLFSIVTLAVRFACLKLSSRLLQRSDVGSRQHS